MGTVEEDTVSFFEITPFGSFSPDKGVSEGSAQVGNVLCGCFCDSLSGTLCFLFGFGELGDFRGGFDFFLGVFLLLLFGSFLSGPEGRCDLHSFFVGYFTLITDIFHELVPSYHFL